MLARRVLGNNKLVLATGRRYLSGESARKDTNPKVTPPTKEEAVPEDPRGPHTQVEHGRPGSKRALMSEDFADEADGSTFVHEKKRDSNPLWPR